MLIVDHLNTYETDDQTNVYFFFICLSDVSGLLDCTSPVNGNSNRYQHPTYNTHMKN